MITFFTHDITHTAPSSPPLRLRARVISSTSIFVQWQSIPAVQRNGNITGYQVLYTYPEGPFRIDRIAVTSITLRNLVVNELYSISVRGMTSAGAGPYCDPVYKVTMNIGMYSNRVISC